MSYLKTGATSDFKILASILTPYGLSENEKKIIENAKKNFDRGMLPAKHSRCAHGMSLKFYWDNFDHFQHRPEPKFLRDIFDFGKARGNPQTKSL